MSFQQGLTSVFLREGPRLKRVVVSLDICARSLMSKSFRSPLSRLYRGFVSQPGWS